MLLKDVSPFIRYAYITPVFPHRDKISYDCRFYYCLKGSVTIKIQDENFCLTQGCAMLFNSCTKYSFTNVKEAEMVFINFDYTQQYTHHKAFLPPVNFAEFKVENCFKAPKIEGAEVLKKPVFLKNAFETEHNLKNICRLFSGKPALYDEQISALFKSIIIYLVRRANDDTHSGLVENVVAYIKENCCENIKNGDIGKKFGYNELYINRIIKRETGNTLRQLVLQARLEAAMGMLLTTDVAVADIAEVCGFSSASGFIAFFKSRVGKTPMKIRNEARS